jgi:hypothetical protein
LSKGELVEIDIKYVPERIERQRYYQFTAIDCASRWRYLQAYDDASSFSAMQFLKELAEVADFKIQAVKTDNGSCFTNRYTGYNKSTDPLNPRLHPFDILCRELGIPHYLIDPGKPHKTFGELKYKLRLYNMEYNNTKHCGLNGKTPNEMLKLLI